MSIQSQADSMAFVYQRRSRPYTSVVVGCDVANHYHKDKGWRHTATIDPCTWIAYLLNHPEERTQHTENLFDATPLPKRKAKK